MLGFGSDVGIGIAITLHDNFTNGINGAATAFSKFRTSYNQQANQMMNMALGVSTGMERVGRSGIGFLTAATKEYMGYEYIIKSVQAITKATTAEMEMLNKKATDISLNTIFNAKESAKLFEVLAKQGMTPKEMLDMTAPISYLAAATDTELQRTATYVTDIMAGMGKGSKDATRMVDAISSTVNYANLSFEQLYQTMKYVSYNANLVGVSMEEVLATVGALSNVGLKGSVGGTAFNNFLTRLSTAVSDFKTARQSQALEYFGISPSEIRNANGELYNLMDVFDVFSKKVAAKDTRAIAALDALFGKRGGRMATVFNAFSNDAVGRNAKELYKLLTEKGTEGYAKMVADTKQWGTSQGQLLALTSAWEELMKTIGQTLIPVVTKGLIGLRKVVTGIHTISKSWLGKALIYTLAVAFPLLLVFGKLATAVMTMAFGWGILTGRMGVFARILQRLIPGAATFFKFMTGGATAASATTAGGAFKNWYTKGGKFTSAAASMRNAGMAGVNPISMRAMRAFVKMGSLGRLLAGVFKPIFSLISTISRVIPAFGAVGGLLGRLLGILAGPVGWIVTIGSIIGWGNVFKTIGAILGTIGNGLLFILDSLKWLVGGSNPITNFRMNQARLSNSLGFNGGLEGDREKQDRINEANRQRAAEQFRQNRVLRQSWYEREAGKKYQATDPMKIQEEMRKAAERQRNPFEKPQAAANVNIYVDSKKSLEEQIQRGMDENLKIG